MIMDSIFHAFSYNICYMSFSVLDFVLIAMRFLPWHYYTDRYLQYFKISKT